MLLSTHDSDLMHLAATAPHDSEERKAAVAELHERLYSDSDIEDERDRILSLRAAARREYWQELGREDAA